MADGIATTYNINDVLGRVNLNPTTQVTMDPNGNGSFLSGLSHLFQVAGSTFQSVWSTVNPPKQVIAPGTPGTTGTIGPSAPAGSYAGNWQMSLGVLAVVAAGAALLLSIMKK